jgi:hypothetical protein
MADEPFALSTVPPALPAQGDYDAICATVMESARGRWFLQEYARRNRNADTRLVLDAIERIEAVIRGDRGRDAYQSFRGDLLEMARAIAQTRAEVAELPAARLGQAEAVTAAREVFAAAERIHEVAWTLRERGLDASTCDQIEAVAVSILSASSLRDPNNGRAHMLGEVLQYLERRINAMLDSCTARSPGASDGDNATRGVGPAPAGNGHDALEPDAAAQAAPMPVDPAAEQPVAGHSVLHGLEAGRAAPVEPEPDLPPLAAAARAETVETPIATASANADASAEAAELQPVHARVETVELELAPLTVVPALQAAAGAGAPAAQLEHAPIIVQTAFAPIANDPCEAEAAAASAQVPATDLMPEPIQTASAQPESAPAAAAEEPPGDMAALEVAPLIATPAEPPARNDAAEIKLDPIAVELAPEPTPEAAESSGEPALELAATPEDTPSLATATALPMELDAPAAAADPQPTTLAAASETIECMPQPEAGGPAPLAASAMTSAEPSEAAAAAAPTIPVEQAVEALPAEPIAASAPALLPEQEVAPLPDAAPLPQGLIEPAIEEPPAVEVEAAVVAPTTPSPGLPAEPQSGAGAPEPVLSVERSAPAVEPLQVAPSAADDATAELPSAQPVATEAPAPDVTVPPAEPETPPAEPEPAGLADFLLEPLPPPVTGGATTQSHSGPGVASTIAPFDPMAEIEEELFATVPQATANFVPPPFDPAATLRPSAPMPMPGAAVPAADGTRLGAGAAPPLPQPTPSDPLAALKAMTDEERIALFT